MRSPQARAAAGQAGRRSPNRTRPSPELQLGRWGCLLSLLLRLLRLRRLGLSGRSGGRPASLRPLRRLKLFHPSARCWAGGCRVLHGCRRGPLGSAASGGCGRSCGAGGCHGHEADLAEHRGGEHLQVVWGEGRERARGWAGLGCCGATGAPPSPPAPIPRPSLPACCWHPWGTSHGSPSSSTHLCCIVLQHGSHVLSLFGGRAVATWQGGRHSDHQGAVGGGGGARQLRGAAVCRRARRGAQRGAASWDMQAWQAGLPGRAQPARAGGGPGRRARTGGEGPGPTTPHSAPGSARSNAASSSRRCSASPPAKLPELSAGRRRVKLSGEAVAAAAATTEPRDALPAAAGEAARAASRGAGSAAAAPAMLTAPEGVGLLTVAGLAPKPT